MQKPCCHFHKMWLSLCPPPTSACLTPPPLPDLYWKDERKGNLDDFILITLSLNDWWFCHRSTGKTVRKQLIKADDFLSKCIFSNWIREQKCILLFFSSPESPLHYAEEAWSYFFPNPFSFCFSCSVPSYLIPPYITATRNGSPVCGLCPSKLCLGVYLLLRINHWQKGKQMEWVCTLLPGVSPSYRQPNHKTDLTIF